MLRGPVRDVVQDFLHRQPPLLRWNVSDEALDVAERQLGLALRQIADIEVELVRTS